MKNKDIEKYFGDDCYVAAFTRTRKEGYDSVYVRAARDRDTLMKVLLDKDVDENFGAGFIWRGDITSEPESGIWETSKAEEKFATATWEAMKEIKDMEQVMLAFIRDYYLILDREDDKKVDVTYSDDNEVESLYIQYHIKTDTMKQLINDFNELYNQRVNASSDKKS